MKAPWMQTHGGYRVDFENPYLPPLDDMVHAIARIGRFTGATKGHIPYSVAQHCYFVARHSVKELGEVHAFCETAREKDLARVTVQLRALLHDLPEAITGDISAPLKAYLDSEQLRGLELYLEHRVWVDFAPLRLQSWVESQAQGFKAAVVRTVKRCDLRALENERRSLLDTLRPDWEVPEAPFTRKLKGKDVALSVAPWHIRVAERNYKFLYNSLFREANTLTRGL